MLDNEPLVSGLEKGVYSTFRQSEYTYRQGQVGSKIIDYSDLQLPVNSVLHICDKYIQTHVDTIYPNLEDPFIKNEKYKLLLDFVLTIPSKQDPLFPVVDTSFRFRPYSYSTDVRKFYIDHRNIKKFSSRESAISQTNTLPILNYNVISTVLMTGTFAYYRKFDILFRTILSNIVSIEGKHQYLQMEVSRTLYRKSQFQQTFDNISYQTVRIKDDQSFYFLIHLINFLSKTATTSLFSKLTQPQLDQLNIVLTAGKKAIIYNMGDLKHILDSRNDDNFYQMVIRHISTLKLAGYVDTDITELDDNAYDSLVDSVAPQDKDQSDVMEDTPVETVPALHIISSSTPSTTSSIKQVIPHEEIITSKPAIKQPPATGAMVVPVKNKTVITPQIITKHETSVTTLKSYDSTKTTSIIDHASHANIANNVNLTPEQKERAYKVALLYKTLDIDGTNIEELLDQTVDPDITNGHLEFLKDKVVDQSMLNSTVIDLDKHYVQNMMAKDIASIAAQMATNGMFLVDVIQKDEITELDRVRYYKLTYEDATGRKHKVAFKLPIVTPDGTILINGIESRMIKQQVNLPICKINSWRVSLSSNYNKTIIERITTKAHSYDAYITKYIASVYKAKVGLEVNYGNLTTSAKLPYDYSCIASRYSNLNYPYWSFVFDYDHRIVHFLDDVANEKEAKTEELTSLEKKFGVYCGKSYLVEKTKTRERSGVQAYLFFGYDNMVRSIDPKTSEIISAESFTTIFFNSFSESVAPPKQLSEWTELKILDKNFPVVFILGFEFGLIKTLDHIKLDYKFYPSGTRFNRIPSTIVVPFADGNLVFDRYPLEKSFVASGLLKFDTKSHEIAKFNVPDGYYTLLENSGFSMNYLKGITAFFKLFVDPITRDVLLKMHEPTDVAGLLLRATQMLTTEDAIPSASMKNHRLRGYERFPSILYNEMARAFATYENQRGNRKIFSINPDAVFLRLIQDQTLHIVDEINPMENLKDKHAITYSGSGGRTAQSFVIEDRRYPDDAVGILAETTPDSGKVAINAYITANPVIQNIRGMFNTDEIDQSKLEPSQILSATSLLMPCSTNDD